ncbi:MAG TPA: NADH-quinone oxidoreductase subunit C [Methylomirabilota bacterium]|jgi:Ni,Fe-hydrogenase III large subunit/Ni,Fe-hydrogenase III component G
MTGGTSGATTDLAAVAAGLERGLPGVTDVRVVRGRELHCRVAADAVRPLAEVLRAQHGAELRLMVGGDRRADAGRFEVAYLFLHPTRNWAVHAVLSLPAERPTLPSLATFHHPASLFEREIFDLFGIVAADHPDPRPLVRHAFWPADYFPLRRDATPRDFHDDGQPFPFTEVGGEGVYEIPVGPVHAGVIEPGHFRFSVVGETIIDMKSRLYFTHKGTEKLFEGRAPADGLELAERVSGDTSVGHALAFCQALEAAAATAVPPRGRWLRVILLEMERLYNHVGDVGMIANDTGYAVAHAHCFRIRERLLRLNRRLTGNRLLRGGVRPGGVAYDLPTDLDLPGEVDAAMRDFEEIAALTLRNTLVMDRLEDTGTLARSIARDHGVLGYVARASGLDADARRDHPFAAYDELPVRVAVQTSGDVKARTLVRLEEARESARLIREAVARLPAGERLAPLGPLPAFEPAFGLVEGWRGGILHWVMADRAGRLHRVKIMDPSFLNWRPLSHALLRNIVPDFPLCNKSFNQSYSGNDL